MPCKIINFPDQYDKSRAGIQCRQSVIARCRWCGGELCAQHVQLYRQEIAGKHLINGSNYCSICLNMLKAYEKIAIGFHPTKKTMLVPEPIYQNSSNICSLLVRLWLISTYNVESGIRHHFYDLLRTMHKNSSPLDSIEAATLKLFQLAQQNPYYGPYLRRNNYNSADDFHYLSSVELPLAGFVHTQPYNFGQDISKLIEFMFQNSYSKLSIYTGIRNYFREKGHAIGISIEIRHPIVKFMIYNPNSPEGHKELYLDWGRSQNIMNVQQDMNNILKQVCYDPYHTLISLFCFNSDRSAKQLPDFFPKRDGFIGDYDNYMTAICSIVKKYMNGREPKRISEYLFSLMSASDFKFTNNPFFTEEFFSAIKNGNAGDFQNFLLKEASPDLVRTHISALYNASQYGQIDIVHNLLSSGANPNAYANGVSAIYIASEKGHTAIVRALLQAGASAHVLCRGVTPLCIAVQQQHIDVINELLSAGAQTDTLCYGVTALHIASEDGNEAIVQALLRAGASKAIQNTEGLTALQIAQKNGHTNIVPLLI